MSSAGASVVEATPQLYFCHQCNRTVSITPSTSGDLLCPTCQSDFVEEFEAPPTTQPFNPFQDDDFGAFLSAVFSGSSPVSFLNQPSNPATRSALSLDDFDSISYLFGQLAGHRARGVNVRFMAEHGAAPGLLMPGNLGDYVVGPGLEELIQQLAENDPNRYGTPPAAKSAVDGLPDLKVDEEMLKSELAQCAVCKDDFELSTEVKQMPCKHVYHKDCILPWLELHNYCPVCRYELPTDDPDYENQNIVLAGNPSGSGPETSGEDSHGGRRVLSRQLTVSLPWPFGGSGSSRQGGGSDFSGGQPGNDSN